MDKPPCVELGKPMNWCARALKEQQIEGRLVFSAEDFTQSPRNSCPIEAEVSDLP
ncbi:hypothetical protein [Dokdonella soli]|uniref:hypothetical protein n=1 Tax=Dokdonella soli TaxID=529810 RepID=UPI0036D2D6E9